MNGVWSNSGVSLGGGIVNVGASVAVLSGAGFSVFMGAGVSATAVSDGLAGVTEGVTVGEGTHAASSSTIDSLSIFIAHSTSAPYGLTSYTPSPHAEPRFTIGALVDNERAFASCPPKAWQPKVIRPVA
jgi:hypothetical protein